MEGINSQWRFQKTANKKGPLRWITVAQTNSSDIVSVQAQSLCPFHDYPHIGLLCCTTSIIQGDDPVSNVATAATTTTTENDDVINIRGARTGTHRCKNIGTNLRNLIRVK